VRSAAPHPPAAHGSVACVRVDSPLSYTLRASVSRLVRAKGAADEVSRRCWSIGNAIDHEALAAIRAFVAPVDTARYFTNDASLQGAMTIATTRFANRSPACARKPEIRRWRITVALTAEPVTIPSGYSE